MKPPADVAEEVFDKIVSEMTKIQEVVPIVARPSDGENQDPKRQKKSGKGPTQRNGQSDEDTGNDEAGRGKLRHACDLTLGAIQELLDEQTKKTEMKIDDAKEEFNQRLDNIENKIKHHVTPLKVEYYFDISAMRGMVNQFPSLGMEMGDNGNASSPVQGRVYGVSEKLTELVSGLNQGLNESSSLPTSKLVIDDNVRVSDCNEVVQVENETISAEEENEPLPLRRRSPVQETEKLGTYP